MCIRDRNTIDYYAGHPYDFEVTVTYDESLLDAFIDEICAALDEDAVNAVVVPDVSGPVVVTEAQIGLNVNREQLKDCLLYTSIVELLDLAVIGAHALRADRRQNLRLPRVDVRARADGQAVGIQRSRLERPLRQICIRDRRRPCR